jgi:hypothetical protein
MHGGNLKLTNHVCIMYSCLYIVFNTTLCFKFSGTFATLRIGCISFVSSVYPNGTNRQTKNGFSRNLVLEDCSKIRRKDSNVIKILQ